MNPFYRYDTPITSKEFDKRVRAVARRNLLQLEGDSVRNILHKRRTLRDVTLITENKEIHVIPILQSTQILRWRAIVDSKKDLPSRVWDYWKCFPKTSFLQYFHLQVQIVPSLGERNKRYNLANYKLACVNLNLSTTIHSLDVAFSLQFQQRPQAVCLQERLHILNHGYSQNGYLEIEFARCHLNVMTSCCLGLDHFLQQGAVQFCHCVHQRMLMHSCLLILLVSVPHNDCKHSAWAN